MEECTRRAVREGLFVVDGMFQAAFMDAPLTHSARHSWVSSSFPCGSAPDHRPGPSSERAAFCLVRVFPAIARSWASKQDKTTQHREVK